MKKKLKKKMKKRKKNLKNKKHQLKKKQELIWIWVIYSDDRDNIQKNLLI